MAVIYLSLSTATIQLPGDEGGRFGHVAAYAALMFFFTLPHRELRAAVPAAVALLVLGVGLEYVQGYLGYRSFERADMAADAVGIALGWLVASCLTRGFFNRASDAA